MSINRQDNTMSESAEYELEAMITEVRNGPEMHKPSQSAEWLVDNKDLFSSDVAGKENSSSPCLLVKFTFIKDVRIDSSGEYRAGHVQLRHFMVCMRVNSSGPLLQEGMQKGTVFAEITVFHLTSIGNTVEITQTIRFENCRIVAFKQVGSLMAFAITYAAYSDVTTVFNPDDNSKIGNVGVKYDVQKIKSTSIS